MTPSLTVGLPPISGLKCYEVENPKVRPRFHPKIVRLARVQIIGRVELLAIGGHGEENIVDIRASGIALNVTPILVFHDDDKHCFYGRRDNWGRTSRRVFLP